ncbi:hypothetical protein KJ562_00155 [Patescibacteria group bacterium]|nr:hypothetical protein [Patescibacteria group bacterium]
MRLSHKDSITKKQQEIILGSILGDGSLEFNGFHGTRLQIKQSARHGDYVFWLYNQLKNLCNLEPKQRRDNNQWYFSTKHLEKLTKWHRLFYSPKKKIPRDIKTLLISPRSLAVWYMDDGSLDWRVRDHYAFTLCTDCFSLEDVSLLKETLLRNFGIEASVNNALCRSIRYPRIYIGAKGRDKFLFLIRPYILDCFSHKLPPL